MTEETIEFLRHNKLKNCPFCNKKPEYHQIGNDHTKTRGIKIFCKNCNVQMIHKVLRFDLNFLYNAAFSTWNNRIKDNDRN